MAFDGDTALYITSNQYSFDGGFQYAKLRIVKKEDLYWEGEGEPLPWIDFWGEKNADESPVFGWVPARSVGDEPVQYLVNTEDPAGGGAISLWRVFGGDEFEIEGPVRIVVNDYRPPPPAEQKGGEETIQTGDCRLSRAVIHGGHLYTVFPETIRWEGRDEGFVRILDIDLDSNALAAESDLGRPGFYYYAPDIAVDREGNVVLVFNWSGPSEHVSLRAVGKGKDDSGFIGSFSLKDGEAYYVHTNEFGHIEWGYANAVTFDSTSCGGAFWAFGAYAAGELEWGTRVSRLAWKECFKRADCNADGKLNIADAVGLLGYLFAGAAPPPEPFKTCGEDPTRDALDCLLYLPCDY